MTEPLKQELLRLVEKLHETDPTTTAYHILLHSIEALDSIGSTIDGIVELAKEDLKDPPLPVLRIMPPVEEKADETPAVEESKADEPPTPPAPPAVAGTARLPSPGSSPRAPSPPPAS